ncbi:MAG: tetratricopeptide repeat protein, partial [Anaerolineales bacterium]|nr:tetratricopeptide repeat protein [Anaerolineales bacterium]
EDKALLLVCDNFEQIDDGAALVAEIATAAPGVQLLITTQQPLNVQAERRFVVGGLATAAADETAEAVRFFQRSARRVAPDFQLTAADLPAVLTLCRLLDGMPLALEIAAGWVRMMDCRAILQETQKSLDFLVALWGDLPPRHQSVRAVLARSWQLLPADLQAALRQMARFAGGFTLPAALAVMPELTMADVAALLDKSLVAWQPDGRYQLHPLLRQFVQQQADGAAVDAFRRRYSCYYLGLIAAEEEALRGAQPLAAIETIQRDLDNVRQAWRWALADGLAAPLAAAVGALARFYHLAGLFEEAEAQMTAALDIAAAWAVTGETAVLQTQLHLQASHFLGQSGQYQRAIQLAQAARAQAVGLAAADYQARAYSLEGEWRRHLNDLAAARDCLDAAASLFSHPDRSRGYAHTRNEIGRIHLIQSRYAEALAAFSQARQIYAAVDDQTEMAITLGNMAEVYRLQANYEQALACGRQALAVAEAIGYRQGIVRSSLALGAVQVDRGDLALARATYAQALQTARELGYLQGIIYGHIGLGTVCVAQGKLDEAETWLQLAQRQAAVAGLQDLMALALGRQGIIHAHRGQHEAAIAAYQQAAQLWRLLNNQTELSLNLGNLGNIYMRQGVYDRALGYYKRALAAVQSVGARQVAANILLRLGNIYKRSGDYERAVANFEQALATYRALQHKSGMASSLGWLGLMQSEMGQYVAAQAQYEQAMALSAEIGDHISQAIWLMNRAEAALHLGQRQAAEALVAEAVALCRTLGSTRFLPGALIHQAEIMLAHGQPEAARLALQEALALPAAATDQQLQFDGRLLHARLLARLGEAETAAAQLRQMLADFASETHQAQLYFDLWQLAGEAEAWETAVRLHEALLAHTPLSGKLRQQLQALHARGAGS